MLIQGLTPLVVCDPFSTKPAEGTLTAPAIKAVSWNALLGL
jgi:hypothetical protein